MPITLNLSQAGATAYSVRDYDGNIVTSGSVAGTSFTVAAPAGGWKCGWYRCYLTGPNTDSVFGNSYGATNFIIVPENSNFATLPLSSGGFFGGYIPSGTGASDAQAGGTGTPLDGGTGQYGYGFDNPVEMITRACLGIGMGRISLIGGLPSNPTKTDDSKEANAQFMQAANDWWLNPTKGGVLDPVRTRYQWAAMPGNIDLDQIFYPGQTTIAWVHILPANPGPSQGNIWTRLETGSVSNYKLTVYYPDSSTVVETYDNLDAAGLETATASSSYIRAFWGDGGLPDLTTPLLRMPTAFRDAMIAAVETLYPLGVTHYEGPYNEPDFTSGFGHIGAQRMKAFQEAVHAGNADAKAIGPCTVDICNLDGSLGEKSNWKNFLDAGGGNYLDEISFHAYNTFIQGDINLARATLDRFFAFLKTYGLDTKPMWQTEAHWSPPYFAPGPALMARGGVVSTLWVETFEQYGIPAERNPYWYDWSHGFWGVPVFLFCTYHGDKSALPAVGILGTLAREKYGKAFHHAIDFGSVCANNIFLGNVYGDEATGTVAVLVATSYLGADSTVTLNVYGTTADLTVVDTWGNESTVSQSAGKVTVPVLDIPTFVRLPAGAAISVDSVLDWGNSPPPSVSASCLSAVIGGSPDSNLADGRFHYFWKGGTSSLGVAYSPLTTQPDTAELKFLDPVTVERVIVWTLPSQISSGLLDFDIQTWDGTSWTTQATVTRTPTSFRHGADSTNTGTELETYDPVQWVDPVTLPTPVSCYGVRVYARKLTYGSAPTLDIANAIQSVGGSTLTPQLAIQEMAVISSTSVAAGSDYPTTVIADSPSCYWKLNEASGSTTAVSQVNSPTADLTATTYHPELGNPPVITSLSDTSCFFEGANAQGEAWTVANNTNIDLGDTFTIEMWLRNTPNRTSHAWLMFRPGSYGVGILPGGNITLEETTSTDTLQVIATSTAGASPGSNYHIAITKNGSTVKIYLNGQDVTGTVSNVTLGNSGRDLRIADVAAGIQVYLGHLALYKTALSQSAVQTHYLAGAAALPPTNTVAPAVTGTTTVGSQLVCSTGKWDGVPSSYTYQWQTATHGGSTWTNIASATMSDFILTSSQSGLDVRCVVSAKNATATTAADSNVVGAIT